MLPHAVSACPEPSVTVRDAPSIIRPEILALAAPHAAQAPRISAVDAQPLLAMFAEARKACDEATERFRKLNGRASDPVTRDPAIPGQLRARRDAANRLPPLANGVRDPFGALAASA